MVDVHSHLIPNVDDGSKSVSETISLIKEAMNVGFTDIILTPHYMINYYEADLEEAKLWKQKLQEILDKEGIKVNLHLGMEVYITDDLMDKIKQNKITTLSDSKYLLMELPLNSNVHFMDDVIFKLINNGITPIIAHPERYKIVQEDLKIVEKLVETGCLIQSNYASILGYYGKQAKKTMKKLLKNNLINFLGTDTHRENTIYPIVPKSIKKISKIIGEEQTKELIENAKIILNNR